MNVTVQSIDIEKKMKMLDHNKSHLLTSDNLSIKPE